ncbi:hypothetical protein BP6252_12887 [Coleophoma cylindrospora]|uniref:Integrase catalytic domain-containing protein n=1 Tax=Coleophoma cylindrospora TaxID=1849047 RepID=A0A3D8QDR1_9HELO|nr:hypothetical protein BP6252_12887 [Coleophoma cylindrospora]
MESHLLCTTSRRILSTAPVKPNDAILRARDRFIQHYETLLEGVPTAESRTLKGLKGAFEDSKIHSTPKVIEKWTGEGGVRTAGKRTSGQGRALVLKSSLRAQMRPPNFITKQVRFNARAFVKFIPRNESSKCAEQETAESDLISDFYKGRFFIRANGNEVEELLKTPRVAESNEITIDPRPGPTPPKSKQIDPADAEEYTNSISPPSFPIATPNEEEEAFGEYGKGFPTERRPAEYRRSLSAAGTLECKSWSDQHSGLVGDKVQSDEDHEKLARVLYTWKDIFITEIKDLPRTDIIEHKIPTRQDAVPYVEAPILYTNEEKAWQKKKLPTMVENKLLKHCISPWSARTIHPRKKNNDLRMVHRYIPINAATLKANYPMRRIEDTINALSNPTMKYFFSADAANGYWAVPIYEPHQYKTGFHSSLGQFCYTVMGQGLTGACGTYARLKDTVTGPIPEPQSEEALQDCNPGHTCFSHFVDDDYGAADTFENLLDFLHDHYFPRVKWAKLTLNPIKSVFASSKITMLGHERSAAGIRPTPGRIKDFENWPVPKTDEELQRFLCTLSYFKGFIPGRADHSAILRACVHYKKVVGSIKKGPNKGKPITRKVSTGITWTDKEQESFNAITTAVSRNIMTPGREDRQWHLAVDASKTGLGGCLFQMDSEPPGTLLSKTTNERYVMFLSFALTKSQGNWQTTEREAYAVVRTLQDLRWLIIGSRFPIIVYTDHRAVLSVMKGPDAHGRISRWQNILSEFNLRLKHIPGTELTIADGLSRVTHVKTSDSSDLERHDNLSTEDDGFRYASFAAEATRREGFAAGTPTSITRKGTTEQNIMISDWSEWVSDENYKDIILYRLHAELCFDEVKMSLSRRRYIQRFAMRFILYESPNSAQKRDQDQSSVPEMQYQLHFVEANGKHSRCVLTKHVQRALRELHDCHGHFAESLTKARCIGKYFWPTRTKDIFEYCRSCPSCQALGPVRPTVGLLPIMHIQPLDMIAIDWIGPFSPVSTSGNKYICVIADYATRWVWAKPTKSARAEDSAHIMRSQVVDTFGWPTAVYSDRGKHFTGKGFGKFLDEGNVTQLFAPTSHPASVGFIERIVQLILGGLRSVLQGRDDLIYDWDLCLSNIVHAIRTRAIKIYGFTPSELMVGYNARYVPTRQDLEAEIRKDLLKDEDLRERWLSIWVETTQQTAQLERLATIEEIRNIAARKRLASQETQVEKLSGKFANAPLLQEGDLVLLRRIAQDNQHSHKLEPRFDGLFVITAIQKYGKAVQLADFFSGEDKGKWHVNDVKLFIQSKNKDWKEHFRSNSRVKKAILAKQPRTDEEIAAKARMLREMNSEGQNIHDEEEIGTSDVVEEWFKEFIEFPADTADEEDPGYWVKRSVNLLFR